MSPPELREKYKDVIPETIPNFPGGDWEVAINDGWYRNVAPNVDRSQVTLAPAGDIAGKPARRWPVGLLLVAPPVLLVCWMVIWPIISAITRTLWLPLRRRAAGTSPPRPTPSSSPTATASTTSPSRSGPPASAPPSWSRSA